MLARGRRRLAAMPRLATRAAFVQGDALRPPLGGRFRLIIVPYNTFMHFSEQAEQLAVLRECRRLLAPDGLLVLDLPNAGEGYASQGDDTLTFERTFNAPGKRQPAMQFSISTIDRRPNCCT